MKIGERPLHNGSRLHSHQGTSKAIRNCHVRNLIESSIRPKFREGISCAKRRLCHGGLHNLFSPQEDSSRSVIPMDGTSLLFEMPASTMFGGVQPTITGKHLPVQFVATLAPSMVTASQGISFLKSLLIFTAGGLFFSTAIAGVTACYAVGMDNVRRFWELLTVILKSVWVTFTYGLGATRKVLLGEEFEGISQAEQTQERKPGKKRWKWRSAWEELKRQLGETRRTAGQGVQALRQEAQLYTAALGPPGLVPLQYVVDRLMPLSLSSIMEENFRKSLAEFPKQKTIRKMTLSSFSTGKRAPVFEAARVYDVENAMAFDYRIRWDSEVDASVQIYTVGGLARIPVSLRNMKFEGTVRVILAPLIKSAPGYGALLVSFVKPPKINLDIKVLGGELTKVPFLKREITTAMQKAIAESLLWPRRTVVPMMAEATKRPLLSQKELAALEESDPLLEAERTLAEDPLLRSMHDLTSTQSGRILLFNAQETDSNITDGTAKLIDKEVPNHHQLEMGIVWGQLQRFFESRKAKVEQTTDVDEDAIGRDVFNSTAKFV